jgi:hypothetical protein
MDLVVEVGFVVTGVGVNVGVASVMEGVVADLTLEGGEF